MRKKEKHIRCVLMMPFLPSLTLVSSSSCAVPSEEKSIKVFRMRAKLYLYTEKMFLFPPNFDVSGPSASEFLIFLSFFSRSCGPNTHAHQRASRESKKSFFGEEPESESERMCVEWASEFRESKLGDSEQPTWVVGKWKWKWKREEKEEKLWKLTNYHSRPSSHSNPSQKSNPILLVLVFDYNMHSIHTISYDAWSSDHFDHFLSFRFSILKFFLSLPFETNFQCLLCKLLCSF